MKYWLFDGDDVIGPFAPHELAAREDFSATSLICAEGASEDSAGWQMASFFDTFRFNNVTGRLENTFLPDEPPTLTERALAQAAALKENPTEISPAPEKPIVREPAAPSPAKPTQPAQPAPVPTQPKADVMPPVMKVSRPKKQEPAFIRLTKVKTPAVAPTPVALAQENADLDLVLPSQPVHAQEEKLTIAKKEPTQAIPQKEVAAEHKPVPATQEVKKPVETKKESPAAEKACSPGNPVAKKTTASQIAEPEVEIEPTCTLPLLDENAATANLPDLPSFEDKPQGFSPSDLAQETLLTQETSATEEMAELVPQTYATADPKPSATVSEPQATQETISAPAEKETNATQMQPTARNSADDVLSVNEKSTATPKTLEDSLNEQYPLPKRPRVKTLSEIKRQFANRPEQEDFILEQKLLARSSAKKSNRAVWIIPLVVVGVLLLVGISGVRALSKRSQTDQPTAHVAATQPEMTDMLSQAPAAGTKTVPPSAAVPKPAAPKPVTASDKALSAVQNYKLPGNKGTIASYFDRVYQPNLEQGYTASWSVEPLHKNTYIVKYRLTKTRMEPIVYVFQADAVRGQLTGALNNIALDLVGRI